MQNMIEHVLECNCSCRDTNYDHVLPAVKLDNDKISLVMISEASPANPDDYFYHNLSGSFFKTTQMAFKDAGIDISTYNDFLKMGIYLTTAIKCSKKEYTVSMQTIKECSNILGKELEQFPNLKVIMCMGDVAIKAINHIYKQHYNVKPVKSGSTYKIRNEEHIYNGIRFFPSYTQTGDSFNIEKSKRQMIAEDIRNALSYLEKI
jgi:uracil-DNA glycosylase